MPWVLYPTNWAKVFSPTGLSRADDDDDDDNYDNNSNNNGDEDDHNNHQLDTDKDNHHKDKPSLNPVFFA